jgi:hypothetical protein
LFKRVWCLADFAYEARCGTDCDRLKNRDVAIEVYDDDTIQCIGPKKKVSVESIFLDAHCPAGAARFYDANAESWADAS